MGEESANEIEGRAGPATEAGFDRRRVMLTGGLAVSGLLVPTGASAAACASSEGSRDFDFLFGTWLVKHRRLDKAGTRVEFEGDSTTRPIAGGLGNLEEAVIRAPKGAYNGAALRLYNRETKLWSIWWADDHRPFVDQPVVGSFADGVGTLTATDRDDPKSMARFLWKNITPRSARWEQATSEDAGATWTTDWEMDFTRVA